MKGRKPFIQIQGLRYAYRKDGPWILDGIDLNVPAGESLLVAGASGSGKSTLARAVNGLIPHFYGGRFEGDVIIGGISTRQGSVADLFDQVGMVFQNPEAQLFNRSVFREIAFGLESLGLPRREIRRRIHEIAEEMEIVHLLDRSPHSLSGGEQQMVCLSAIAALRPRMIVLDEPFANLDSDNAMRFRRTLTHLRRAGMGVLVCEHRLGHAADDAGRMVILDRGRKIMDGPPAEVMGPGIDAYGLETAPPGGWVQAYEIETPAFRAAPAKASPLMTIEKVSFRRDGRTVLDDVSFSVHPGECVAIVGPNGAGKTTLLKHFNGLLRPSSGRVLLEGRNIRKEKVSRLARHVGMAFQNPTGQFFKLSVWDEITVAARAMNRYDPAWIDELVRLFRLETLTSRPPYRLSDGEKKRVAFAAALSARPDLLVLDEPTSGQDRSFKEALGGFLTALQARGQTVVLVTHDLDFAARYACRWLVLKDGRITTAGTPRRVCRPLGDGVPDSAGIRQRAGGHV